MVQSDKLGPVSGCHEALREKLAQNEEKIQAIPVSFHPKNSAVWQIRK